MSSFFDDASLVMIPSGYKDGKVYSVKPTSGAGDLTFTRNSNATRVDANGLVEKVRTNLLTYSNDTSNPAWTRVGATPTSGQSGYDGSSDAWLLTATGAGAHYALQSKTDTGILTFSIYAKQGTSKGIRIAINGGGDHWANFNLELGTQIGTAASVIDTEIVSVGSGWYRISVTANKTTSSGWGVVYILDNSFATSFTAAGQTIYIQDAQLEQGLVATDYIETTTTAMSEFAGVTASSVADVPRLDYSGGSCPSLLLEPQRTNLVTYSEYFGAWTLGGTTTIDFGYLAPDGTNSAYKVTNVSSGSISYSGVADQNYSRTIYARTTSGTGTAQLCSYFGNTNNIFTITEEWQRFEVNTTTTTTGATNFYGVDFRGVGTLNEIILWGAQSENASYATSYIPTYGTTVTRLADSCSINPSTLLGATEGSWFLELDDLSFEVTGTSVPTNWIGYDLSNCLAIEARAANQAKNIYFVKEESNAVTTLTTKVISTTLKACFVWNGTSLKCFVDGVKAYDAGGFTQPVAWSTFQFNSSGREAQQTLKQTLLFPTAISDADAIALTA